MGTASGIFRDRIMLYRPERVKSSMGADITSYIPVVAVSANVTPMAASERFTGEQMQSVETFLIKIRSGHPVKDSWRISYRGLVLEVEGVQHLKNNELSFLAKAGSYEQN